MESGDSPGSFPGIVTQAQTAALWPEDSLTDDLGFPRGSFPDPRRSGKAARKRPPAGCSAFRSSLSGLPCDVTQHRTVFSSWGLAGCPLLSPTGPSGPVLDSARPRQSPNPASPSCSHGDPFCAPQTIVPPSPTAMLKRERLDVIRLLAFC